MKSTLAYIQKKMHDWNSSKEKKIKKFIPLMKVSVTSKLASAQKDEACENPKSSKNARRPKGTSFIKGSPDMAE
ncbi:hypothetical protein SNE40_014381 [Patella caerulea]|uniref:Uncharacterized protein n=1 Tax=Patella caerulea TaxID=87958 RepID=A0AAN8JHV8_PATCE